MIFGAIVLVWIISASDIRMLALPLILLIIREMYLDRGLIVKALWFPAATSLLFFLYLLAVSKASFPSACLQAGRIFASSIILIHLTRGFLADGPSYSGKYLGTVLLLTERCLILEKRMMSNALYGFNSRRRHSRFWSRERANLVGGIILTATSEFLRLAEDLRGLYRSRGANPVTKGWVVPRTRRVPITYADLIFVLLIGFSASYGISWLVSDRIRDLFALLFRS